MKNKPVKHKTTNTFKFIPFAERINAIDIRQSALYHIEHANIEQPAGNETHFNIALRKWHVLNLSQSFNKLRKELAGIITLPQLIFRKQHVVDTLITHLNEADPLALQPLLEILVCLAKDLRDDFNEYFSTFFDILVNLLDTKDAEQLEWVLICLAFMFKILRPYLKKDISSVLKRIIPLLSESHPSYINNFAAESFSFIARDIKDKKKFLYLMLHELRTNENAITGSGHLIFEILHGVRDQFHSCAEPFLQVLFAAFEDKNVPHDILFAILTQTISDVLTTISPQAGGVLWNEIINSIEHVLKLITENTNNDFSYYTSLENVLKLTGQLLEYQQCRFMTEPLKVIQLVIKVSGHDLPENIVDICTKIGILLILSPNIRLSQEHAGVIIKLLIAVPYPNILLKFIENLVDYSQFEMLVLPQFLQFIVDTDFNAEALHTLSKICLKKSPISVHGSNLFNWVKYPIDFGKASKHFIDKLNNILDIETYEDILKDSDSILCALVYLPHIKNINVDNSLKLLENLICKLCEKLRSYSDDYKNVTNESAAAVPTTESAKVIRRCLFFLSHAIESSIHISSCKSLQSILNMDALINIVLPFANDHRFICALQTLDLYLTAFQSDSVLKYETLIELDVVLRKNLSSPFHVVRLFTTHIYMLFEKIEDLSHNLQVGNIEETFEVFSLCYEVEQISPSVQQYREQIVKLQRMAFNTPQHLIAKKTKFHKYPLQYLFGVLYYNFKLLWEPIIEMISSYANGLTVDEFWELFHKILLSAADNIKKEHYNQQDTDGDDTFTYQSSQDIYKQYNYIKENPSYISYRILIWQMMSGFAHVCETRNRDITVLFLNFIDEEYRGNDKENALKANVKQHTQEDESKREAEDEIQDLSTIEIGDEDHISGKDIFKTLLMKLQMFSKLKNPRALYKEPALWELYLEFLTHKNAALQKCALDCVLTYKNKHLVPYKDHLYNFVDEKKFKDELTLFRINVDNEGIHKEDRPDLIPIILRIMYGKMISRMGADKKSGGQTKRSLILRYIAGCTEEELIKFTEMAFSIFSKYMNVEVKAIYKDINDNLDLKSILRPSKLVSTLNLVEVMREYFGGYMGDGLLPKLFKVVYAISSITATVLSKTDEVHIGYIKVMKNIRTSCLTVVRKFFNQFENYPWSKDEIYVIFETLIWPILPKLHTEGIYSPTALIKLLNVWAHNPRYFILLTTCRNTDNETLSPLPLVFKLLQSNKTHMTVVKLILDMLEKLLTLQVSEEDLNFPVLDTYNQLPMADISHTLSSSESLNFGSTVIIPHIPIILEVMKRRISNSSKTKTINKRDILILSRITELVTTPKLSEDLLSLLLPILVKKICSGMAEENMEYAITTIMNLISNSPQPEIYTRNIAPLFNHVVPPTVRKLLCNLLRIISDRSSSDHENYKTIVDIVVELNAYNKKWLDQPDFDRRLDAYKRIYQMSDNGNITLILAIMITHNCFFFLRTEKDISLRDSAALCLKKFLPKLFIKYKSVKDSSVFIRDTVLYLIASGVKCKGNEILRNESLGILGELVRESPDTDVMLTDLVPLADKVDREVDFFDNMAHLQIHRVVRAFQKFSKVGRKINKYPTPRTLTQYILPLASSYLCNDTYVAKNSLIDSCIDTVCTACRLLPWYQYEMILKYYLNKLRNSTEYQKQLTRLIVGILDAFHFDLSKVQAIDIPKTLPAVEVNLKNQEMKETEAEGEVADTEEKEDVLFPDDEEKGEKELSETQEVLTVDCETIPAFQRNLNISQSVAKRIIRSIRTGLLPQLNRAIAKLTEHEGSHKVNRKKMSVERQEEDIMRVPIALALVKLLQKLPGDILKQNLSGIIMKLCTFLKSPLKQVRIATRDTLKKIMTTIGPSYLGILIEHLQSLLQRGFQVHVLIATIHTVLEALKTEFKSGDIDENFQNILDICVNDLFGVVSEEKEVSKLGYKTPEAKPSKKSYVTLTIIAQNINESCLIDLLVPFKDVLGKTHSKKVVTKVQDALTHIATGLVNNKLVNIESLFVFLYGIASESIPELVLGVPKRVITESQREKMIRMKPDCFLIPEVPKRHREAQMRNLKTSAKTSAHVLVEFSLNMLYVILKREKLPKSDSKPFIDPLIQLLVDSLRSHHVKVSTSALKCLTSLWTLKISTPTLNEHIKDITQSIFTILHKYAVSGVMKQDDNYHLVKNAFKATTALVRHVKYHTLDADQLKTLLLYCEDDCENNDNKATSFSLLKAILDAQLIAPELHEVMQKVAKITILSESAHAREESRVIFVNYLMNYPLGKKIEKHMHFFVSQLSYEMQHGRVSALKFLQMIINKFPLKSLIQHSSFLFLSLGTRLLNDSAVDCRKLAAACIELLITKLDQNNRSKLFDLTMTLMKDDKPVHFEMAAQLCSRFVAVEQNMFKTKLATVMPIISQKMFLLHGHQGGRFVRVISNDAEANNDDTQIQKDHSLIQNLNLLEKLFVHCPSLLKSQKYYGEVDNIAQQCQTLLGHGHGWVRLKATKILEAILQNVNVEELNQTIKLDKQDEIRFLCQDTENVIKSLVLDLCAQLTAGVSTEMADQVMAVVYHLFKIVRSLDTFKLNKSEHSSDESDEKQDKKISILWIISRLGHCINSEVAKSPMDTTVRTSIFTSLIHIVSMLEKEELEMILRPMMVLLVREITSAEESLANVRQLANRIGKKIRRKLGDVEYNKLVAEGQIKLNIKRADRRKVLVQEKIRDPEKAAKRKLHVKEKKKLSKRRKIEMLQGKRPRPKKRKAIDDIEIEDTF